MSGEKPKKILVCRTDKIGDVILTLPVISNLRKAFPDAHIGYLAGEYTKKVLEGNPDINEVIFYEPSEKHRGLKGVRILAKELKAKKFDTAIVLYPRPAISAALFLAGIPERIGTAFRWYSFFHNKRVKMHRKDSKKHELEYNLDLLAPLAADKGERGIKIHLTAGEKKSGFEFIRKHKLTGKRLVSIHPGSAVSVLNWPLAKYKELVEKLVSEGNYNVLLIEGKGEHAITSKITQGLKVKPAVLPGSADVRLISSVLNNVDLHISSNTGTMHIAAAMGTRTLSFFNPVKAVTPKRFGAWGNNGFAMMPNVKECVKCTPRCKDYNCMDLISVSEVLNKVDYILAKGGKRK